MVIHNKLKGIETGLFVLSSQKSITKDSHRLMALVEEFIIFRIQLNVSDEANRNAFYLEQAVIIVRGITYHPRLPL
jgi:hypothetical protein